nr:MAG TPA: hypothetical protein [Caudoviricetes sp.]
MIAHYVVASIALACPSNFLVNLHMLPYIGTILLISS